MKKPALILLTSLSLLFSPSLAILIQAKIHFRENRETIVYKTRTGKNITGKIAVT